MKLEDAVLQLVRLGLGGDAASVAKYSKRLLRDLAKAGMGAADFRESLAALVASAPTTVARFVESQSPTSSTDGLLAVEQSDGADAPVLEAGVAANVADVVREHQRASDLEAAGLSPTRTVLLTGPPGVGKTITARYMASQMGVPLFRVDLSAVMSSLLGKSAQNLRAAFDQARAVPSVMLLDEFDAIGKRRDDPADVGELKRIVNVLLLELEAWPASGLLVAATNHPELLDRAVWRRFERVIPLELPSDEARRAIILQELRRHSRTAGEGAVETVIRATAGMSGSDITTLVRGVVRRSVLAAEGNLESMLVVAAVDRLLALARTDVAARRLYCEVSSVQLGSSQREIAGRLGVSHVAVGKILRAATAEARAGARGGKANHV